jgi:primosomal protein N' (replication factor Y) (superfamily II helicase)
LLDLPPGAEVLGPIDLAPRDSVDSHVSRLILRAPRSAGRALVRNVKEVAGIRSARKSEGALRIRVDPVALE